MLADLALYLLRPLALLWVLTVLIVGFRGQGVRTFDPGAILAVVDRMEPVVALGGLAGFAVTFWLIGLAVDAFFSGGIYASFERALADDEVGGVGRFLDGVGVGFPKVVGLSLLSGVAQLTLFLIAGSLAVAVGSAFWEPGGLAEASVLAQTLALAVPAFVFFSLAILVRLTFRVAVAPLFLEDDAVGAALLEGAEFLIARIAAVYKLVAFAAGLLLAPLIGIWVLQMLGQALVVGTAAEPLLSAAEIAGQVVLYTSFSLASLLFYGAVFAFYAAEKGRIAIPAAAVDDDEVDPRQLAGSRDDASGPYDESTRLEELLPEENDRTVDFADVPGLGGVDEEPDEDDTDE